ncbi:AraC family transcriptional regulator [Paenibacillus roseipurpureus]|uniref:AraC family transcriptional regulator n=1 Tax=Paenibacillus roseopurpureus TaxID=2918901 RepID=A0AA96RPL5_9BACL|nr:AraC family transcriptional regulator [Paenibacillus sp. MBLB1832]WNR46747.1 AraC family transcriptional regulator [Paenibacillus sp. MBLB1832]
MPRFMDNTISPYPLRIITLPIDASKLKLQSLRILNVGHLPGRIMYREHATFEKWAIVYIAGGSGTYRVNQGPVQQVESGSLFVFRPNCTYHYGPAPGGYWDEFYFSLEGSRIKEWQESWLTQLDQVKQVGTEDAAQQHRIERIFNLMESGIPGNIDRAALLVESLLFEFIQGAEASSDTPKSQQHSNLIEDLTLSIYQAFDAQAFANRHHISLSTLRRIVNDYSGFPLNTYIHRMKMAEAKNILLNTTDSVKVIASSLGYKDEFYFSRIFKKYVGVSPLLFRKSMHT